MSEDQPMQIFDLWAIHNGPIDEPEEAFLLKPLGRMTTAEAHARARELTGLYRNQQDAQGNQLPDAQPFPITIEARVRGFLPLPNNPTYVDESDLLQQSLKAVTVPWFEETRAWIEQRLPGEPEREAGLSDQAFEQRFPISDVSETHGASTEVIEALTEEYGVDIAEDYRNDIEQQE